MALAQFRLPLSIAQYLMGHGVRLASKVQKVTRNVEDNLGKVVAAKKLSVFVEKSRSDIELKLSCQSLMEIF